MAENLADEVRKLQAYYEEITRDCNLIEVRNDFLLAVVLVNAGVHSNINGTLMKI
jgi:hypothetical protein